MVSQITEMDEPEPTLEDDPELPGNGGNIRCRGGATISFSRANLFTLLSVGKWSLVEGQVASAPAADLEEIRRSACATEWQEMLLNRRAPEV